MRGSDTPKLSALLTAATNWRTAAANQGVELFQINTTFPDGKAVTLVWREYVQEDSTSVWDWEVVTQQ